MSYDLSDCVYKWFPLLVVRFEPEDECGEGLGAEWLHRKNKGEEQCLPACQEADEGSDGIWFAFGFAAG